jgi:DNA-binding transcriptional LysR family regulator
MFPPISSIRALEAAVRLGGFSAAAGELGISQSAVSQGIKQLERQLGVDMFARNPGRVTPTEAGQSYAKAVAPALATLLAAAIDVQPPRMREVKFGCSRAILNHWLLPRLTRSSTLPGRVDVIALERAPKDLSGLDIAIVNGTTDAAPIDGARLLKREMLVAVGAPSLVREHAPDLARSSSLDQATLLGGGWEEWSAEAGVTISAPNAVRLRETSALMAAVRAGEGFALLPSMVCADAIRDEQLAVASAITVDRGRGYWLVEPKGRQDHAGTLADWLCNSFASSTDPQ